MRKRILSVSLLSLLSWINALILISFSLTSSVQAKTFQGRWVWEEEISGEELPRAVLVLCITESKDWMYVDYLAIEDYGFLMDSSDDDDDDHNSTVRIKRPNILLRKITIDNKYTLSLSPLVYRGNSGFEATLELLDENTLVWELKHAMYPFQCFRDKVVLKREDIGIPFNFHIVEREKPLPVNLVFKRKLISIPWDVEQEEFQVDYLKIKM